MVDPDVLGSGAPGYSFFVLTDEFRRMQQAQPGLAASIELIARERLH